MIDTKKDKNQNMYECIVCDVDNNMVDQCALFIDYEHDHVKYQSDFFKNKCDYDFHYNNVLDIINHIYRYVNEVHNLFQTHKQVLLLVSENQKVL